MTLILSALKISELPLADTISDGDLFAIVQGGVTKRLPASVLPGVGDSPSVVYTLAVDTAGTISIPAATLIDTIILLGTGSALVGTSVGGSQLINETEIGGTSVQSLFPNSFFASAGTLHFTGTFTVYVKTTKF